MSDNIRVELTPEEMVQAVKKVFKKEHADLMGNCIVDILFEDGNGMESFFKATMGITPSVDYSVGDRVLCQADSMQDWRFDKEKMKNDGLIVEGLLTGKITHVRPFNKSKTYVVEYKYIDKDSGKMKINKHDTHNSYVKGKAVDVFPGE